MSLAFEVNRSAIDQTRVVSDSVGELQAGEARFRIESVALTANNVTYALFGEQLQYWKFFPASDDWGRLPVWGFAEVVETKTAEVEIGSRWFGFWPLAEQVIMQPSRRGSSLVDRLAHRQELPGTYNRYQLAKAAASKSDAVEMTYRPLYMTAYLIVEQLKSAPESWDLVIVSSASSKTALGTGFVLRESGIPTLGLTSSGNLAAVKSWNVYDDVVSYDDLEATSLSADRIAYVDIAGNATLRRQVHAHASDALLLSLAVGASHHQIDEPSGQLTGPRPELFFAPSVLEAVSSGDRAASFNQAFAASWDQFSALATSWLRPIAVQGVENAGPAYAQVRGGEVQPDQALIINFQ